MAFLIRTDFEDRFDNDKNIFQKISGGTAAATAPTPPSVMYTAMFTGGRGTLAYNCLGSPIRYLSNRPSQRYPAKERGGTSYVAYSHRQLCYALPIAFNMNAVILQMFKGKMQLVQLNL